MNRFFLNTTCASLLCFAPVPFADDDGRKSKKKAKSSGQVVISTVEVVDEDGKLWRAEARGILIPEFTPSHLNEHKVLGLKVTLTFYREGDVLVLTDITD